MLPRSTPLLLPRAASGSPSTWHLPESPWRAMCAGALQGWRSDNGQLRRARARASLPPTGAGAGAHNNKRARSSATSAAGGRDAPRGPMRSGQSGVLDEAFGARSMQQELRDLCHACAGHACRGSSVKAQDEADPESGVWGGGLPEKAPCKGNGSPARSLERRRSEFCARCQPSAGRLRSKVGRWMPS